jgi:hypothetical protein
MPDPVPATTTVRPQYVAIAAHERACTASVLDGDSGRTLAVLSRASAARYAAQLEHAARTAEQLVRLVALSDEDDVDAASFVDALDAFDRWHDELRTRHAR